MKLNKVVALAVAGVVFGLSAQAQGSNRTGEVTLIHMGDLHGHLVPHASVRSDSAGKRRAASRASTRWWNRSAGPIPERPCWSIRGTPCTAAPKRCSPGGRR